MTNVVWTSVKALAMFTILTGFVYPLIVTAVSRFAFQKERSGSLIERDGRVVGSELIAQKNESPAYFQPRPSASDFGTLPSGASNLSPTSSALRDAVAKRKQELGGTPPADLLLASGSGLDPHISPEAAAFQVDRVSVARKLTPEQVSSLRAILAEQVEKPTFGLLGQPRVNVLRLNLSVDQRFGKVGAAKE